MENLNSALLIVQVILSVSLIVLVLMQHGKGADAGAAFGSGSSSTVFGSKGSGNFLTKTTAILATLFFVVCMSLAYLGSHRNDSGSLMQSVTSMGAEEAQETTLVETDLPPVDASSDVIPGSDLPPAN
ncbi:MAG: preprotein translocase subunit SecG [Gammaproteobacteria bacterium]|jgi:preprotein translocase subunit SecG